MAAERINMETLQQWAFRGIPEKLPRALIWKVLNIQNNIPLFLP
jgi:hypothetical protein